MTSWTRIFLVTLIFSAFLGFYGCASAGPKFIPKLSSKEAKLAKAALPEIYAQFLTDVEPIISPREKDDFLSLGDNMERDEFIQKFWKSRSPEGRGDVFEAVYRQRLEIIRDAIEHPSIDPSRLWLLTFERAKLINQERNPAIIFLLNGPPDDVKRVECENKTWPIQIWHYSYLPSLRKQDVVLVLAKMGGFEYKLWIPRDGQAALMVDPNPSNRGYGFGQGDLEKLQQCFEWREILQATALEAGTFGDVYTGDSAVAKLVAPPPADLEKTAQVVRMSTAVDRNFRALDMKVVGPKCARVSRDAANQNKVIVAVSFLVSKENLKIQELDGIRSYTLDAILKAAQNGSVKDQAAYRFDINPEDCTPECQITASVQVYPGKYKLIAKVTDANEILRQKHWEDLVVAPEIEELPEEPVEAKEAAVSISGASISASPDQGATALVQEPVRNKPALEAKTLSPVLIVPPARQILVGVERFQTVVSGGVFKVAFILDDGEPIFKNKQPFEADVDLGDVPRRHNLKVVGYNSTGKVVGQDRIDLNYGAHSTAVHIISPSGPRVSGKTQVQVGITVPDGMSIRKVDFFLDDALAGTRTREPWAKDIVIPSSDEMSELQVVATFNDGSIARDRRFINLRGALADVKVDVVELYAVVKDGRRTVEGLKFSNFEVLEDGVPQKIETFAYAKDSPILYGILIDTSDSMKHHEFPEVLKAAVGFIDKAFGQQDAGFTMGFSSSPYMLTRITADKGKLKHSLAGLRPDGFTALYDAVMNGLYELQDFKGKKALVVLTDGRDEGPVSSVGNIATQQSEYSFSTLKAYAAHAGVMIYTIGFKLDRPESKADLEALASVSGGKAYSAKTAAELERAYQEINEELHSQYVFTYYSRTGTKNWRAVSVKTKPKYNVRTIPGYYPSNSN